MPSPLLRTRYWLGNLRDNTLARLGRLYALTVAKAAPEGSLVHLARYYQTDKQDKHFYAEHYQHHFQKFRERKFNLLEIGVGGHEKPDVGGHSLRMWKAFFPHAQIYGLDIFDKSALDEPRIKTLKGSQADEQFLKSIVDQYGPFDIIIDDGSHYCQHVLESFRVLFPLLSDGGIYAIEDLQTSYWENLTGENWGGSHDLNAPFTSMNFLKSLVDGLNFEEYVDDHYQPSYYDRNIVSMHFYHNLAFLYKGKNNEGSNFLGNRFWKDERPDPRSK